jgi:hypothetical protein
LCPILYRVVLDTVSQIDGNSTTCRSHWQRNQMAYRLLHRGIEL